MNAKPSWMSWPVASIALSVALFGVIVLALALSQQAPAGPNVTAYESPT